MKATVVFQPSGRRGSVPVGISLLEAARLLGVALHSPCGGQGTCGKCQVQDPGGDTFLACRKRVEGDGVFWVPRGSAVEGALVRKAASYREVSIDPVVTARQVAVSPGDLNHPEGEWERIRRGLNRGDGLRVDGVALPTLSKALIGGQVKVVLRGDEAIGFLPPDGHGLFGVAIDLGTTTIAAYLCCLETGAVAATASRVNPQIPYGDDVMSRITAAMTDSKALEWMVQAVRQALGEVIEECCRKAGIEAGHVAEITVAANTVMHHILLGIDPEPLGMTPFSPVIGESLEIKARDLGLAVLPGAYVYLPPNRAGFLGGDNMAALLAEGPWEAEERVLFIDVGTNGEMELGNRHRLAACSCPTGPALEGAHIQHGMRAAAGAIEGIAIDPETWEPALRVIGGGRPKGLCGSAIIDGVAELHRAGILKSDGSFNKEGEHPRLRRQKDQGTMEYVLCWAQESDTGQDIVFTQKDVRAVQLAKGALYAGAKVLMKRLGWDKIDRLVLAGAFGSYIDPLSALRLGMIPDLPPEKIVAVGNAAGEGARLLLLSRLLRRQVEELPGRVEYVELTMDPDFQEEFMAAMYLPHQKDSFIHLD